MLGVPLPLLKKEKKKKKRRRTSESPTSSPHVPILTGGMGNQLREGCVFTPRSSRGLKGKRQLVPGIMEKQGSLKSRSVLIRIFYFLHRILVDSGGAHTEIMLN